MIRSSSCALALGLALATAAAAQRPAQPAGPIPPGDTTSLPALVQRALAVHPSVQAAEARAAAARARVLPAGAWPDPMLMAGIQNFPAGEPGSGDEMTMKMVGLSQTIPHPGRAGRRRSVAEREAAAAQARVRTVRLEAEQRVREAYYELAYLDRALETVQRNQRLLYDLVRVSESRYGVGTGSQSEVLQARVEAARMAEEAMMLAEQRGVWQARLNEAVDRYSESPVPAAVIPERIVRVATPASAREARFVSPSLGARAAGSPLPPLLQLEEMVVEHSPVLREQAAMTEAQAARLELARREHLPDVDVALQYGQRDGYPDMFSLEVSLPLPVRRGQRQRPGVAEAQADVAAAEAARHEARNRVRLEVARLHSEAERARTQLALYVGSILPQARAALESTIAGYQVGRADLPTVLQAQATVFNAEIQYHRLLSDFAQRLAELERVVGTEVLR